MSCVWHATVVMTTLLWHATHRLSRFKEKGLMENTWV